MFIALSNSPSVIAALQPVVTAIRRRDASLSTGDRAASSIALHIAEGAERVGLDLTHLSRIAAGSCREVRSALKVAMGWRHVSSAEVENGEALLDWQARPLYRLTRLHG